MTPSWRRSVFLLAGVAILCLAFWIRITNLYSIPIFADEGGHIEFAQAYLRGQNFPFLFDGKYLLIRIALLLPLLGPSPLWLARGSVAVFSLLSCSACIAIGCHGFSKRVGLLAGLIYVITPYAVFFERQFLADTLMAGFGSLAIFFALVLAKRGGFKAVVPLALALAAAFFAKLFGLVYLLVLLPALVLATSRERFWNLVRRYALACSLAFLGGALFVALMYPYLGDTVSTLVNQKVGFIQCPDLICQKSLSGQIRQITIFADLLLDFIPPYLGWPLVALSVLALPLSAPIHRRQAAYLFLSALGMMGAMALTVKLGMPPRYIVYITTPVVTLAALGVFSVLELISRWLAGSSFSRGARFAVGGLLLMFVSAMPVSNTIAIITETSKATLSQIDLFNYYQDQPGPGATKAALAVLKRESQSAVPPVIILDRAHYPSIMPYFDPTLVDFREPHKEYSQVHSGDIYNWLSSGQSVYIFADANPDGSLYLPPNEFLTQLLTENIGLFPQVREHGESILSVRRVVGAKPELSQKIFADKFLSPRVLAENYRALVDRFRQNEETPLIIYPPHQTEVIAQAIGNRAGIKLQPIGETWPLNPVAADQALLVATDNHSKVAVVFLDEARGDPTHSIETWLNTNLFRAEEEWLGPVRLIWYAGRTSTSHKVDVNARFGEAMVLDSFDVLDTNIKAGELVRVRLTWRATALIARQMKVFVHLFADEGIVAQHDGQPVGELRPTTTWQKDEKIVDQFALRIPEQTRGGRYKLRIGVYDMITQSRSPVVAGDGQKSDLLIFGDVITIQPR
ncbi:MAG: glycosyltransferase family 39 protein [Chloroflexota bacterium]